MSSEPITAILGYTIAPGVSVAEYDEWLWKVHYPDLLANPHLDRIVLNTVIEPITATSAGTPTSDSILPLDRIAELQFSDREAYGRYLTWFEEHPIPAERSPAGRTTFRFYVLCEETEATRQEPRIQGP